MAKTKSVTAFWCLCLALVSITLPARTAAAQDALRRRAYFGMAYLALTPEQARAAGVRQDEGVFIRQVLPGGPAERAGVRAGDVVTRLGPQAVTGQRPFADLLRLLYEGEMVEVEVVRDGRRMTLPVAATAPPPERGEGVDVEYTSFTAPGAVRLRAVVISPSGSRRPRLPGLLIVTALVSARLIDTPGYSSTRSLAHAAARAGFRVLRFEARGSGDSEGSDYREAGLHDEVADNVAAFDALRGRPDVDPARVFVYGHSTEGLEAAVLAGRRQVAGIVVSCTIGRTFYERMVDTLRLQGVLAGNAPAEIDGTIARYLTFTAAIASGFSKTDILRRQPGAAGFFNTAGRIMDDRTIEFWRDQMTLNVARTYGAIKAPALILWGESDFLTARACHEHIRDVLVAAGNADVTLVTIPGLDHAYAHAKDFAESHAHYKSGGFVENPAARKAVVAWLQQHVTSAR